MCAASIIMDQALSQSPTVWLTPDWPARFQETLENAHKIDKIANQTDCELDEKRLALRKIADELGVKIDFV